jgi:cytoskeletal protein CcmA (bactofilin family)
MKQDTRASIGRTTRVVGRITGTGDLLVEGRCEGEVNVKGHLEVARGGVIDAPVSARDVTIEGGVHGDVTASGAVVLRSEGSIRGAIHCDKVALEDGAKFTGRIEMNVELPDELGRGHTAAPKASGRGK